jgi:NAD(P) transhydrogenase subunit alpha
MPRITRAQSMDILSSQANLAGYKAVLDAAAEYGRAFPMMMTAAGTISAARVFVMGVGVAGLQAIATARRLGAQVSATDVRSATREQIMSLGAKPIFVENVAGIEGEGSGGYATEMSRGISEGAGRAGFVAHRQAGHRHHHRADPGSPGAAADFRRADRFDAAGLA